MAHPFLFLVGYRVYETDKEHIAELIDLCRELGISYRDVKFFEQRVSSRESD